MFIRKIILGLTRTTERRTSLAWILSAAYVFKDQTIPAPYRFKYGNAVILFQNLFIYLLIYNIIYTSICA